MQLRTILAFLIVMAFVQSTFGQRRMVRNQAPLTPPDLSADEVRQAILDGRKFLLRRQGRDGKWQELRTFADGTTGLATLALLNAGVPADSDRMQAALTALQRRDPENLSTYSLSLRIMAFALADPAGRRYRGRIQADVRFLERSQVTDGIHSGGWGYGAARDL